jgi:hypothetical protein
MKGTISNEGRTFTVAVNPAADSVTDGITTIAAGAFQTAIINLASVSTVAAAATSGSIAFYDTIRNDWRASIKTGNSAAIASSDTVTTMAAILTVID